MCMEDVQIGRAITKARVNASVGLVALPLLQADDTRYAIAISTDGVAIVYIGDSPDVTVVTGLPIKITDQVQTFLSNDFGDFVRGGIWVVGGAAGPTNVGVVMSMLSVERFHDVKRVEGKKNGA